MKLSNLNTSIALFEIRRQIGELLSESISDYLALTVARLKSKTPDELFLPGVYALDLDQLAEVIAGLKILSNADYRETMTKDDLGINPNSYKELFELLKSITKDGKDLPRMTKEVFAALKSIAPSIFKKTRTELEVLKSGKKPDRAAMIQKISAFSTKVNQMFYKVKHGAEQPADKKQAIAPALDPVDHATI